MQVLEDIYELVACGQEVDAGQTLMGTVDDWCWAGSWDNINDLLNEADPSRLGSNCSYTLLTLTHFLQDCRPAFRSFYRRYYDWLREEQGQAKVDRLLTGKFPTEDDA